MKMKALAVPRVSWTTTALCMIALLSLQSGSQAAPAARTAIVTLSLSRFPSVAHMLAGDYAGVSPGLIRVHVGDEIIFVNADSRHHTATSLLAKTSFPDEPHWADSALRYSGNIGSADWSTGDIAPGARSAPLTAKKAGTYLYGCFYDYSAGVRGVVVVEP